MLAFSGFLRRLALLGLHVSPASTILNDVAIATIATGVMLFYLLSTHTEHIFLRAKERMNLAAELNHHLRQALIEFRTAADLEDREERLRMLDRAIDNVDQLLLELVPTVKAEVAPRFKAAPRQ